MGIADEWVLFLEEHPQFFELSKGGFFIPLLKALASEAQSFSTLLRRFPRVERRDMRLILEALVKLKAVERIRVKDCILYSATADGRELLRMYKKTKPFFEV